MLPRSYTGTCRIPDCQKPSKGRVCSMHRERIRTHGTPDLPARPDATERFWAKVDRSGDCWLWTGGTNVWGYGVHKVDGRSVAAHRFSWTLEKGPVPQGLVVCHTCDTPACVRPDHLFVGTQRDNIADMWAKGRAAQQRR